MNKKKFITVSQEMFEKFLDIHPKLERNAHTICDPVMISYNDFSMEKFWPESMVARCKPASEVYEIREDYMCEKVED